MMRVAMLGSYPTWPFREELGLRRDTRHVTTTWNVNLAEGLARRGNLDVHVVTLAAGIRRSHTLPLSARLHVHFLAMQRWQKGLDLVAGMRWSQLRVAAVLRDVAPDVVHGVGTEHPFAAIATRLAWPSVITVHGVMRRVVAVTDPPWWSPKRVFARVERRTLARARHVIVINPYVQEALDLSPTASTYRIENPIGLDYFTHGEDERAGLVFVGMIQRRKGLDVLLEAMAGLDASARQTLSVVGAPVPGELAYASGLRDLARQRGLEDVVEWVGPLDPQAVAARLRRARALVLPSREETAPMVIAEALASGTPVVASDVGGVRHMVAHGRTGYVVPPERPDELARAIGALEQLGPSAALHARTDAKQRFHPDRVAEATEAVYRRVIGT